jgi:hypothetical protein
MVQGSDRSITFLWNLLQFFEGVWSGIGAIIHAVDCQRHLRVRLAGLAIMPERSFNIRFFILFLGDLVDGGFDVIEVLRVLESERVIVKLPFRLVMSFESEFGNYTIIVGDWSLDVCSFDQNIEKMRQ